MMMGILMEFFLTVSLSICLGFLFSKLVSMASSVGGNQDVGVSKSDVEPDNISGFVRRETESEEMNVEGEGVESVEAKEEILGVEDVEEDNMVEEIPQREESQVIEPVLELEIEEPVLASDEGIDVEVEKKIGGKDQDLSNEDEDDDDDWEGIEKSEVNKLFGCASKFVSCAENNELLSKLGNGMLMQLYGLHKVAMEGPCRELPPLAIMVSARAKWNAWQRMGNMTPEVAMEQYVNLLSDSIPGWLGGNHEGDHEVDKVNLAQEAGESRKETDGSVSIDNQPDSKNERKPEELHSQGECSDDRSF